MKKKTKKSASIFCQVKNSAYLCNVKQKQMAITLWDTPTIQKGGGSEMTRRN